MKAAAVQACKPIGRMRRGAAWNPQMSRALRVRVQGIRQTLAASTSSAQAKGHINAVSNGRHFHCLAFLQSS